MFIEGIQDRSTQVFHDRSTDLKSVAVESLELGNFGTDRDYDEGAGRRGHFDDTAHGTLGDPDRRDPV